VLTRQVSVCLSVCLCYVFRGFKTITRMEMLKYYIDIFCISDAIVTLYFDLYLKYILIVLFILNTFVKIQSTL